MRIRFWAFAFIAFGAVIALPALANAYSEMVVVEAVDPGELVVETSSGDVEKETQTEERPAPGDRRRNRSLSCKQRIRQIVAFDDQIDLAQQQGNRTWEDATWIHVNRLEGKLAARCPAYYAERRSQQRMIRLARQARLAVRVAGEAAKRFFTGGLAPGL